MIDKASLSLIKQIISKYNHDGNIRAFIYGSRTSDMHRTFSDVDIGLESRNPIPTSTYIQIQEDLENSDIPYRVDLVDFSAVSDAFKNTAKQHILPI